MTKNKNTYLLFIGVLFLLTTLSFSLPAASYIDSLKIKLKKAKTDSAKVRYLNAIAWNSLSSDPDTTFAYATKSLELSEKTGNNDGLSNAMRYLGIVYENKGNYSKALELYVKSLKIKEELKDYFSQAALHNDIGLIYKTQKKYDNSISEFTKSIAAVKSCDKSAKIKFRAMSVMHINIGSIYRILGKFYLAQYHYRIADKIAREHKLTDATASCEACFGNLATDRGNHKEGIMYYFKAMAKYDSINNKYGVANSLVNIGNNYCDINMPDSALYFFKKSMQLGIELNGFEELLTSYEGFAKAYSKKNMFKEALEYHKKFKRFSDSLFFNSNDKKITEMTMNYEFERKIQEAEEGKKMNELEHKISMQKNRSIIYIFLIAISVVITITIFIIRSYKARNKINTKTVLYNKQIQEQSNKLAEAYQDLVSKNIMLSESIDYAHLIQEALLPPVLNIEKILVDYFIINKPKDIVSGDFLWHYKIENTSWIALCDCSGHGVPGAYMSIISSTILSEIIKYNKANSPVEMLKILNENINKLIWKNGQGLDAGLDISLLKINNESNTMVVATASQPIYLVTCNSILKIETNKVSIGGAFFSKPVYIFEESEMTINPDCTIYLMSDGWADLHNSSNTERFSTGKISELLTTIYSENLTSQKTIILDAISKWISNNKQTDDILITGFKSKFK